MWRVFFTPFSKGGPDFPARAREGERRARGTKGGILFPKRIPPLNPPEKGEGSPPSTPDIAGLELEELHALRNVSAVYMASP